MTASPRSESRTVRFRRATAAFWRRLRGGYLSPRGAASSVGVGLLVGLSPFYGLHAPLVLGICLPLRLDVPLAYAATMIANPLTLPLLLSADLQLGSMVLGTPPGADWLELFKSGHWRQLGAQVLVGSLVLSTSTAAFGAGLTAWLVYRWQRRPTPFVPSELAPDPEVAPRDPASLK